MWFKNLQIYRLPAPFKIDLEALNEAAEHLQNAMEVLPALEFFAEELRLAQNALSKITGEFSADDLLGEIFSHFCIGK